jgi:[acyl-carrier-protein] S-malonyltransferase
MGVLSGKKLGFVFPGQGSQTVGMGRDLVEHYPSSAKLFERADAVLGYSLSDLCFDGPEEDLTRTINTQPALYVTSAAALAPIADKGYEPIVTAGHSVGEYAALYAAGAFTFEDGLKLVRARAELMNEAAESNPGSMAAILGLTGDQVKEAVAKAVAAGVVVAANFNTPTQTVISGESDAFARACEIASEMGAKRVIPLAVSGAFHSPLMQGASDCLAETLRLAQVGDTRVPVVANVTAQPETTAAQIRENLARQLTGSVRWVECVEMMVSMGVETFVEVGSGNVLAGLIRKIAPDREVVSIGNPASVQLI